MYRFTVDAENTSRSAYAVSESSIGVICSIEAESFDHRSDNQNQHHEDRKGSISNYHRQASTVG